jgi:hypothetical protein
MKWFIIATVLILSQSLICQQGSVSNPQSICISPRYIEGCNQYLSESACKVCNYRYVLLSSGLCELDKDTTEDCCKQRASDGKCISCQTGLYLINGKCQESNIIGCLEKDSRGICLNCASNFFLNNGACSPAIKNCVSYSDDAKTICTDCRNGFSLINNICVENSVLGCRNEVAHVCRECYKPFQLANGNCEIPNCKTYNEYRCVTCHCGYYLNFEGVCKAMEQGCVRYQRGQCTDCLPNFKLKGSVCELEGCLDVDGFRCKKCDNKYNLVDGACKMKNCISWKDGACDICEKGFNYSSGNCIAAAKAIELE